MTTNSSIPGGAERAPMGQCPLCYTDNAYSLSRCHECNLPLPWAKADVHEREPCGACFKCETENPYTTLNCWSCGSRLPWSNAVSAVVQKKVASNQMTMLATPAGIKQPAQMNNTVYPTQFHQPMYTGHTHDGPNQVVDVVSFLCPPLGFVSYVTLLATLPRQAVNAAKFALIGSCVWFCVLTVMLVGQSKFHHRTLPAKAPVTTASVDPETAGEVYQ